MRTIFKYPIHNLDDEVVVNLPKGAEIISVGVQMETLCLWAIVDSQAEVFVPRKIQIRGTGQPLGRGEGDYIGTVLMSFGALVWHVFASPEV